MRLEADVIVNGSHVVASDAYSWEMVGDGNYQLRLPEGIWRSLAEWDSTTQFVAVRIRVKGLATVESLDSRLRGLESTLKDGELHSDYGLWLPPRSFTKMELV